MLRLSPRSFNPDLTSIRFSVGHAYKLKGIEGPEHMKLYRLNVTAHGEPSAIFALAEDVDSLLHALEYQDHGDADEESLLPYYDGDKKPRVIRSLEEVPEDYLDFVCLGDNPEEYTVAEFFDTQE